MSQENELDPIANLMTTLVLLDENNIYFDLMLPKVAAVTGIRPALCWGMVSRRLRGNTIYACYLTHEEQVLWAEYLARNE